MSKMDTVKLTATFAFATELHRNRMQNVFHICNSLLKRCTNIRFQGYPEKIIPIYLVDF